MDAKKSDRRKFLKGSVAAAAGLAADGLTSAAAQTKAVSEANVNQQSKELIAYGGRSRFVTSVRVPVSSRPSPDMFGMMFHIDSPLQDSMGFITPSSLHFVSTHRGAIVPDINPKDYRLLVHGLVDRPTEFTLADLKRFPAVSRIHFLECAGNRANSEHKTVQDTHGLTSCAEWTGVPLSVLLNEVGVQKTANWVISEGAEEVKGASSIQIDKAMDDCIVCYGMNGEPIRPQNGFPVRLMVPGFEGIHNTKWLRRMKLVDKYYMTYNDYGHMAADPTVAALGLVWGPKSVITYPSGGQKLADHGAYQISGLAWSGSGAVKRVEVSVDGGQSWKAAELQSPVLRMAHTRFSLEWKWSGEACVIQSRCIDELDQVQLTRAEMSDKMGRPPGFFKVRGAPGVDNSVQPWRIDSDGSVHNAI